MQCRDYQPIRLVAFFAPPCEGAYCERYSLVGYGAESPQFSDRLGVVVDDLIQLERIDPSGIVGGEALTHVL